MLLLQGCASTCGHLGYQNLILVTGDAGYADKTDTKITGPLPGTTAISCSVDISMMMLRRRDAIHLVDPADVCHLKHKVYVVVPKWQHQQKSCWVPQSPLDLVDITCVQFLR